MGKYSTPLADFVARLTYHTTPGAARLLDGFRWELDDGKAVPTESTQGYKDMPALRLYLPSVRENFRPRVNIDGTVDIRLHIASARQEGIVKWMESVEKVMDALQYKAETPLAIGALAGTLRHFDWSMTDNFIAGNSLIAQVIVTTHPNVRQVAGRRT